MADAGIVKLRVLRQDAIDKPATKRWESFEVPSAPRMTVHDCLEAIRRKPTTADGKAVAPVVFEASCLDESCGACTMLIDGKVRHACSTVVADVSKGGKQITVAPLSRFPVERDLVVDRGRYFDSLRRVKAWVRLDKSPNAQAPAEAEDLQQERYELSTCIGCAACLEACPEFHESSAFLGAAAINDVRRVNLHGVGKLDKRRRLELLMTDGGVADCGKAQNCVEVCPKQIPLVDSIAEMSRDTTKQLLFGWLLK